MSKRSAARAVARGLAGTCPACGRGALLRGYITPIPVCAGCGEDLTPYQTADFAPYLVTFAIGLIFMPLTLILVLTMDAPAWTAGVLAVCALALAALLLPRAKGAAIGLLWALDARS